METKVTSTVVRRQENAIATKDLANLVVPGSLLCQSSGVVATGTLSPELELVERKAAEERARREAAMKAKEAAARMRAEQERLREEAARVRREARVREVTGD